MPIRLAANVSLMFTEMAFLDRFAAAAACGFEAVEFLVHYDESPSEIAMRLDAAGVEPVLFNAPPGDMSAGDRGLACRPERVEEFKASLDRVGDLATTIGCPRVHMMAGVTDGLDSIAASHTFIANLQLAADHLGSEVAVMVEPLNTRDVPGYLVTSVVDALRYIDAADRPNIALQFDSYHCQIMGGDMTMRMHDVIDRIGHVQISSVPDRHEPDTGELDHDFWLDALDTAGYAGWVGCEYRPRGETVAGLGWAERYGVTRP